MSTISWVRLHISSCLLLCPAHTCCLWTLSQVIISDDEHCTGQEPSARYPPPPRNRAPARTSIRSRKDTFMKYLAGKLETGVSRGTLSLSPTNLDLHTGPLGATKAVRRHLHPGFKLESGSANTKHEPWGEQPTANNCGFLSQASNTLPSFKSTLGRPLPSSLPDLASP